MRTGKGASSGSLRGDPGGDEVLALGGFAVGHCNGVEGLADSRDRWGAAAGSRLAVGHCIGAERAGGNGDWVGVAVSHCKEVEGWAEGRNGRRKVCSRSLHHPSPAHPRPLPYLTPKTLQWITASGRGGGGSRGAVGAGLGFAVDHCTATRWTLMAGACSRSLRGPRESTKS